MTATAGATEMALFEERLDRAMAEVFETMVGASCHYAEGAPLTDGARLTAMIGLAGALRGSVVLESGVEAALRVAALMTGSEADEMDATVRDAMGEMANMVAGAWKGYDPGLASRCLLSPPTVVVGQKYELFNRRAPIRITREYRFEGMACVVSVNCERG